MITGEEGITSDLMVELWGSGVADVGASAAAAAGGLFSTGTLADESGAF